MPYISEERRAELDKLLPNCQNLGEVAYVIARVAEEQLFKDCQYDWANLSYRLLAGAAGNIHLAGVEFERRVVVPYEELKRRENGEVYAAAAHVESQLYSLETAELAMRMQALESEIERPQAP